LASEQLRRQHEAERAALTEQQQAFIEPFQAISEMTAAFDEAIEELDKSLKVSLRLAAQDPARTDIVRATGPEIVNAIVSADEILTDRQAVGNAYVRSLVFQDHLETIADKLVLIFHGEQEQKGVPKNEAIVYLNQRVAAMQAPEEIKKTLGIVLHHLNTLDHFITKIESAHEKINAAISGGLADMMFDQVQMNDDVDIQSMGSIGDKIRNAAEALKDDSNIMSLGDSLQQFERLLTEAKDVYLDLFVKYRTSPSS
jgi:Mg2+ and Co2+ transporter CorA